MKRGHVFLLVAVLALSLAVSMTGQSLSGGIGRTTSPSLPAEGCNCHSEDGQGAPSGEVEIYFRVDPNPAVYEPLKVYNLSFGAAKTPVEPAEGQNKGGFNLRVNVGTLAAGPGYEDFVQELNPDEFTHTLEGDKAKGRDWNLTWTAPAEGSGPAIFRLWINTVDGSNAPDANDRFNLGIFVVPDVATADVGAAAKGPDPEHIGVNWLAHWVGIVSVMAVVGTLLIYYFVLKFGESIHTTDHRDRKEK